ncbi:MAG: hypothetical protein GY830_02100 [Bacteroidetes bacterium]|nr:hypothetical protein [Bacteroidota bacterium]
MLKEKKDKNIVHIVSDKGKYFDENNILIKRSNWQESIIIFEKVRPDRFLFIIDNDIDIENAKKIIKQVKTRTLSTKITILLDKDIHQEHFNERSIDRFYHMDAQKMLNDWAKLISRNED